jgi:hypothetical protein
MILYCFNVLVLKIFLNFFFDTFPNKKHFEPLPHSHSQALSNYKCFRGAAKLYFFKILVFLKKLN